MRQSHSNKKKLSHINIGVTYISSDKRLTLKKNRIYYVGIIFISAPTVGSTIQPTVGECSIE